MSDNRFSPSSADKTNPYSSTNPWGNTAQPSPSPQTPASNPTPAFPRNNTESGPRSSGNPYASPQDSRAAGGQSPAYPASGNAPSVPNGQIPGGASWPSQPGPGGAWAPYGEPQPQKPKKRWVLPTAVGVTCLFLGFSLAGGNENSELRDQVADLEYKNTSLSNDLYDRDTQIEELRERVQILESQDPEGGQGSAPSIGFGPVLVDGFPGEGVFLVGLEVEEGTYESSGQVGCFWTRTTTGMDPSNDETVTTDEATQVTLTSEDLMFVTSGCADWVRIG